MCDTFVATKSVTESNVSIFAKNSDRPPNEAQHLVQVPALEHTAGESVRCTYISIPQVKHTNAILLSQPFWMWGAEIGVNEHGLAIGNEAVFSKVPANKKPALLGMDLLRLALERAATPEEAISVIIELLETYGQGGNCVHSGELYYHNTFLLANSQEAWVLETIDKQWAAKKVDGTYSISNVLTLGDGWDKSSDDLISHAVKNKVIKTGQALNITQDYSDFLITTFSNARNRCSFTKHEMDNQRGELNVNSMMSVLRGHGGGDYPGSGLSTVDVCMHAGFGPIRISQSTASLVVYLSEERPTVFATGTSAPCTSIFKPFWVDAQLPDMGPRPTDKYDASSLFWTHERLHRSILRNPARGLGLINQERDKIEHEFVAGAVKLASESATERAEYSAECLEKAIRLEQNLLEKVQQVPENRSALNLINIFAWNKFNKEANMSLTVN